MNVKSVDSAAKKFAQRGSAAGGDYAEGVKNPRTPWAQATAAAEGSYAAGVQAAVGRGAFKKGVTEAGDEKWGRKAAGVGAARYGPGVQAAQGDYSKGVAPFLDVLRNVQLPPRGPKGDPGNINRVNAVASALRAKKISG